jgi:hypothetical protein
LICYLTNIFKEVFMPKIKATKLLIVLLSVLFLLSSVAVAQNVVSKIVGTVTSSDGGPLPGVTVIATGSRMVGQASTVTDENGKYRLLGLTPGTYTITFELEGFNKVIKKNIVVHAEETLSVNVKLKMGELKENIVVTADVPLIDIKSPSTSATLTKEVIDTLPKGRDFSSLITLMPSVNNESALGGISVDGASGSENQFYIDGMDITTLYGGRQGIGAATEFVEEVQVKTSGYQAEYGGAMGGVINVITRSGGNEFHGDLIGYYSGSVLTGHERDTLRLNPYDRSKAEYVNYQNMYGKDKWNRFEIGFDLGGYIIKDKVWFFGSLLPRFQKTTRHIKWLSGKIKEGSYDQNGQWWNFSGKLSSQLTKSIRMSAGFTNNFYKYKGDLPPRDGSGNSAKKWGDYGFSYPGWTAATNFDIVLSNNAIVNLRGGYYYNNRNNQLVKPSGPRWVFAGPAGVSYQGTTNKQFSDIPKEYIKPANWSNYGYGDGFQTKKDLKTRANVNIDFNYYFSLAGEHSIKAGVQFVRIEVDKDDTYAFPYIRFAWGKGLKWKGKLYKGKYGVYGVRSGKSGPYGTFANPHSVRWALYVQDSWTIGTKLTVNYGIRAEKEDIPSFSDLPEYKNAPVKFGFKDKIAPRFGFVYDVFEDSSFKIFGSFGLFYDVMKLEMAEGSYGGFKWKTDYYTLDTYKWDEIGKNGNFPGTYIKTIDWRIPSFDNTDPGLKPMSQREITLGFEKKIMENFAFKVRFVQKHLRYAIEDVGVLTEEGEKYYTTNPGYGWSRRVSEGGRFADKYPGTPRAKREYYAVNISLEKRFSNNWWGGVSYTWSRLTGNYSGLASSDEGGRVSPNVERYFDLWWLSYDKNMKLIDGPLATDRTHQIKVYGAYKFPFGLTVGFSGFGMSGTPVTTMWNVWTDFFPFNRGDLGRTPFLMYANSYLEYDLKLGNGKKIILGVNASNIFNTKTATGIYSYYSHTDIHPGGDTLLKKMKAGTFDIKDYKHKVDPRWKKKYGFFGPWSARFNVKFVF